MPIEPQKLAALVEEQNMNPMAPIPGDDMLDEEPIEGETGGEEVDGESLLAQMGEFGDELRDNADIIIESASEIGEDLGVEGDYSPSVVSGVEDAVDRMPEHMIGGMAEHLAGMSKEDLTKIAEVLVASVETEGSEEGDVLMSEPPIVAGFLDLAGKRCAEIVAEEGEEEGTEEEETEVEEEDEGEAEETETETPVA
jgi:hypothetical protein